jgi:hypothetical protein
MANLLPQMLPASPASSLFQPAAAHQSAAAAAAHQSAAAAAAAHQSAAAAAAAGPPVVTGGALMPPPSGAAARSFTLRMDHAIWCDDKSEWKIVTTTKRHRIACPPSVRQFYIEVERWAGLKPGTVSRWRPEAQLASHLHLSEPFGLPLKRAHAFGCSGHVQDRRDERPSDGSQLPAAEH